MHIIICGLDDGLHARVALGRLGLYDLEHARAPQPLAAIGLLGQTRDIFIKRYAFKDSIEEATDKLHAWRLSQYSRVVFVDADMMIMRPLDELFEQSSEFTAAHHESDFAQSLCGVPIERRIIAAMFMLKPSAARFDALARATHTALQCCVV